MLRVKRSKLPELWRTSSSRFVLLMAEKSGELITWGCINCRIFTNNLNWWARWLQSAVCLDNDLWYWQHSSSTSFEERAPYYIFLSGFVGIWWDEIWSMTTRKKCFPICFGQLPELSRDIWWLSLRFEFSVNDSNAELLVANVFLGVPFPSALPSDWYLPEWKQRTRGKTLKLGATEFFFPNIFW